MARVFLDIGEPVRPYSGPALFSAGHRPFFLFTAITGVVFLAAWILAYAGLIELSTAWHGHEMVFGFAGAAVSGFLMAAVPKWTNAPSFQGRLVIALSIAWLLGRVGILAAEISADLFFLAWLDILYPPMIAVAISRLIMGAENKRNYIVPVILFTWVATNLAWHFWDQEMAVRAGIYMIIAVAALISGRIIPAFTQNALRMKLQQEIICETPMWTHKAVLIGIFLITICEVAELPDIISGVLAAVLTVVFIIRMMKWHTFKTFDNPIVWVLHAAYIWLPIGFGLKAVADLTGLIGANEALHGLTTGAIGMLILAVASRAALGHSGRPLIVSAPTIAAYVIVTFSAIVRVIALSPEWIIASGILWVIGFGLFAAVYAPILIKPRIDGLPG
jgi:uncharacterized protein involved in response to NO